MIPTASNGRVKNFQVKLEKMTKGSATRKSSIKTSWNIPNDRLQEITDRNKFKSAELKLCQAFLVGQS